MTDASKARARFFAGLVLSALAAALASCATGSKRFKAAAAIIYPIDQERAVERLSSALKIPTVSNIGEAVDWSQFSRFGDFLRQAYPLANAALELTVDNGYNLIYFWKGSDPSLEPILLMGHYDVFAVTETDWKRPPFSGDVAEGYVWGRGAIDDKSSVVGIMEAAEYLAGSGFRPRRSVYLAFGQDEENGGRRGAAKEVEYFKAKGVSFEAVMDEGLYTVQGSFPGLPEGSWVDLVGTAEKGFLNLKLTAQAPSGHSSMPPRQTSVGIVAAALARLESSPFPARWTASSSDLLRYLAPEAAFPYNLVLGNRWLFGPLLASRFAKDPKSDALIRTTIAPTVFNSGGQPAALPGRATAIVNIRLLPGDTMKSATEAVRRAVKDPRVVIEPLTENEGVWDPPPQSNARGRSFLILSKTIREVMPGALAAPCLVTGATDARYYAEAGLSENVYRSLPLKVPSGDIEGAHGKNERVLVASYIDMINYYARLIENFSLD